MSRLYRQAAAKSMGLWYAPEQGGLRRERVTPECAVVLRAECAVGLQGQVALFKPLKAWQSQLGTQTLCIREVLRGVAGIFKAPKQLVDGAPLLVQRVNGTDCFIGLPELLARHAFPEVEPRQV